MLLQFTLKILCQYSEFSCFADKVKKKEYMHYRLTFDSCCWTGRFFTCFLLRLCAVGEHVAFHPTGGASSHTGHCDGIGHIHTDDWHRRFQSGGGTDTGHQVQVTFMFIAHCIILTKNMTMYFGQGTVTVL